MGQKPRYKDLTLRLVVHLKRKGVSDANLIHHFGRDLEHLLFIEKKRICNEIVILDLMDRHQISREHAVELSVLKTFEDGYGMSEDFPFHLVPLVKSDFLIKDNSLILVKEVPDNMGKPLIR